MRIYYQGMRTLLNSFKHTVELNFITCALILKFQRIGLTCYTVSEIFPLFMGATNTSSKYRIYNSDIGVVSRENTRLSRDCFSCEI